MTPAGLSGNKGLQAEGVRARTAVAPRSATPPGNDKESHHRAYHSPDHRRCNPARATRSLRACGLHQNNLSCDWTTQQGNARASPSKAKAASIEVFFQHHALRSAVAALERSAYRRSRQGEQLSQDGTRRRHERLGPDAALGSFCIVRSATAKAALSAFVVAVATALEAASGSARPNNSCSGRQFWFGRTADRASDLDHHHAAIYRGHCA
jgi:hypothetical protein